VAPARLHDVPDIDSFCSRILDQEIHTLGASARPDQREEMQRFLVETMLGLAERFEPGGALTFEWYAGRYLRLRVTDWYRREFGDSRAKNRRHPNQSLDALLEDGAVSTSIQPSFEDDILTRVAIYG
jgi:hypothetical protein